MVLAPSLLIFLPYEANAQGFDPDAALDPGIIGGGSTGGGRAPGGSTGGGIAPGKGLQQILDDLIDWSVGLGLAIAALIIIYAAYQMLFAGGNTEQFTQGRKTIVYAIAGVFVLALSRVIIGVVRELLGF